MLGTKRISSRDIITQDKKNTWCHMWEYRFAVDMVIKIIDEIFLDTTKSDGVPSRMNNGYDMGVHNYF